MAMTVLFQFDKHQFVGLLGKDVKRKTKWFYLIIISARSVFRKPGNGAFSRPDAAGSFFKARMKQSDFTDEEAYRGILPNCRYFGIFLFEIWPPGG
ncbi:MAG: hypothetical protein ACI4PL_07745 [Faecousia sp.]